MLLEYQRLSRLHQTSRDILAPRLDDIFHIPLPFHHKPILRQCYVPDIRGGMQCQYCYLLDRCLFKVNTVQQY